VRGGACSSSERVTEALSPSASPPTAFDRELARRWLHSHDPSLETCEQGDSRPDPGATLIHGAAPITPTANVKSAAKLVARLPLLPLRPDGLRQPIAAADLLRWLFNRA